MGGMSEQEDPRLLLHSVRDEWREGTEGSSCAASFSEGVSGAGPRGAAGQGANKGLPVPVVFRLAKHGCGGVCEGCLVWSSMGAAASAWVFQIASRAAELPA
eukprot:1157911-Pelagomonas_calceolata.AAC.5